MIKKYKIWLIISIVIISGLGSYSVKAATTTDYLTNADFYVDMNGKVRLYFIAAQNFETTWIPSVDESYCTWNTPNDSSIFSDNNGGIPWYNNQPVRIFKDLDQFTGSCTTTEQYINGSEYFVYVIDQIDVATNHLIYQGIDETTLYNRTINFASTTLSFDDLFYLKLTLNNVFEYASETDYWYSGDFHAEGPAMDITYPTSGTSATSSFTLYTDYWQATGYDRIMIQFESWNASSSCPEYGSATWAWELTQNYFNYQSFPFFSDYFETASGTISVDIDTLPAYDYNCVRCYFVNESTGDKTEELCTNYTLNVPEYIENEDIPHFYSEMQSYEDYYNDRVEKWATSTELFLNWAEAIDPFVNWADQIVIDFNNRFTASTSAAKGKEMGEAIPVARGYLSIVNNFFNDLPISEVFIFYLITTLVIVIIKIIKFFITTVKP